jgi:hypothetical protein
MKIDYQNIIKTLAGMGERQFAAEHQARAYVEDILTTANIVFAVQEYETYIPKYHSWSLQADGEVIESLPCGLVSGEIKNADVLLSSLISSQKNFYDANINFNPRCEVISRSNHYMAPALAVRASDVRKILQAKTVEGCLEVEKTVHTSANILVGNTVNPKTLIVSHYDSISSGAVDNASGIALSLKLIIESPELLGSTLFILCGNEELSYDETIYWGHGYREFESAYPSIIQDVQKILVLDSFGYSPSELITDIAVVRLAFPIKSIENHIEKIVLLSGSYEALMAFYHAENDQTEKIKEEYFSETEQIVRRLL